MDGNIPNNFMLVAALIGFSLIPTVGCAVLFDKLNEDRFKILLQELQKLRGPKE